MREDSSSEPVANLPLVQLRYLVPYILITAFQYFIAKDALGRTSPFLYGATSFLIGGVVLFAASKKHRLIINRDTLLFSLFFWLSSVSWLVGLNYISPPQSAVISFTMPLFVIPLAVWILKDRSSRTEAYGAVIGFAGIVVFNLPLLSGTTTLFGVGITLADAFFWALYSVYMKKLQAQDTVQTLATAFFFGFLLYGALSFTDLRFEPSLNLVADIVFLGVVSFALNMYLWLAMIKVDKVGRLTTIVFAAPIVALAYGVVTTGQIPSYVTLLGVALIFLGIFTATILSDRSSRRASARLPVTRRDS